MPNTLKLGLKLFVITVVAAFALSLTNMLTAQPILDQIKAANEMAQREVLANADHFEQIYIYDDNNANAQNEYPRVLEVHEANNNNQITGYTLKIANKAYGGELVLLIGINTDDKIEGIRVLQHSETPGLGANVQKLNFNKQYEDKSADSHIDSKDIDLLSGATITTNAVTGSVNAAIDYYNSKLVSGGDNQ